MNDKRKKLEQIYAEARQRQRDKAGWQQLVELFGMYGEDKSLNRAQTDKNNKILENIWNNIESDYVPLRLLKGKYIDSKPEYQMGKEKIVIKNDSVLSRVSGVSPNVIKKINSGKTTTVDCSKYLAMSIVLGFSLEDYEKGRRCIKMLNEKEDMAYEFVKGVITFNSNNEDKYDWEYIKDYLYENDLLEIKEEKERKSRKK